MKNMTFHSILIPILTCLICLYPTTNLQSKPVSVTAANTSLDTYQKTTKEIKATNKLNRKIQRFQAKMKNLVRKSDKKKDIKIALIAGLIFFILGIILIFSAISIDVGLSGFFVLLFTGAASSIIGLITLIIGALIFFNEKSN